MLSARSTQVLEFIRNFVRAHGYGPTMREIQEECGMSSSSVAEYHVVILERNHLITRVLGQPRTIQPVVEVSHD